MKYYRYMSEKELNKLLKGDIIEGRIHKARTSSVGVCFLGESTNVHGADWNAIECYEFLSGIVSSDVLVEFDTEIKLNESWGIYADPAPYSGWFDTISITEYCIGSYSLENFKITRIARFSEDEWNFVWQQEVPVPAYIEIPKSYKWEEYDNLFD